MAKQNGQKEKLLIVAQQLLREGDENHPVTVKELIEVLADHGIHAERKSIYRDMETLREFGLDIQHRKKQPSGWFLGQRDFELPELKLLVDAVQSSRFISRKKSEALIEKLGRLTSREQAKQLQRQVYVNKRVKTDNERVYYVIDELHGAISAGKVVRFYYFDYNVHKEKVYRRDKQQYTVSPYGLIWMDENYYLVGWDHLHQEMRHYRVDKMESLRRINLPRQGDESCQEFDLSDYGSKVFHMFSGEETMVQLRCTNRMVNAMMDRFGQEVMFIPDGWDHFTLTVEVSVSPQFYGWLLGMGDEVALVGPDRVVEEWHRRLLSALDR